MLENETKPSGEIPSAGGVPELTPHPPILPTKDFIKQDLPSAKKDGGRPEISEDVRNTYGNKRWRIENLYKIRTKQRSLIRMRLNGIQQAIYNDVIGDWKKKKGVRHFTLKPRQVGVSTFWMLFWLDDTITRRNTITGVLAHKWDNVKMLMEIARIAYLNIPERWRPPLGDDTKQALTFPTLNSKFFSGLSIRSTAVHNLHISEWCFCADREIGATLGAVAETTNVSGESTGNGVGNDGYTTYQQGKVKENAYAVRFFPWFVQKEYQSEVIPGFSERLSGDEQRLITYAKRDFNVDISHEQLAWRRKKISDLKGLFPQEYPESDEDAFRTAGSKFFEYRKLHRLLLEAKHHLDRFPPVLQNDTTVQFEKPDKYSHYVAGADTADEGMDYSVLKIINVTKRREALVYRARCGVDRFYRTCDELCRQFNNALLAVESNNHGRAVILGLETNTHYPRLYAEENPRKSVLGLDVPPRKTGWTTTSKNRVPILDALKFALEGDSTEDEEHFMPELLWLDQWLLKECLTFERIDGKYQAVAGEHDDVVMATAIAIQMYHQRRAGAPREVNQTGFIIGGEREARG